MIVVIENWFYITKFRILNVPPKTYLSIYCRLGYYERNSYFKRRIIPVWVRKVIEKRTARKEKCLLLCTTCSQRPWPGELSYMHDVGLCVFLRNRLNYKDLFGDLCYANLSAIADLDTERSFFWRIEGSWNLQFWELFNLNSVGID